MSNCSIDNEDLHSIWLTTTQAHQGEGQFPLFSCGSQVKQVSACEHYLNWFQCEIEGYLTYVPLHFIQDGKLIRDYNPTELSVRENELVRLLELHYEWAMVQRESEVGWLPCKILKTALPNGEKL